ncbi:hypothetical protein Sjap_003257 [Stephania japonica]|uniref:At1g61320/AtMIF1 LRR domain-containing protein n=1 Tax=Stephania japonica TaxID=461633 RepID=A0AAP0KQI5_9MAGN
MGGEGVGLLVLGHSVTSEKFSIFVTPQLEFLEPFPSNLKVEKICMHGTWVESQALFFAAEKKVKDLYLDFFTEETLHMFHHCSLQTVESHSSVLNITEMLNQITSLRVLRLTCCGLKDFKFGHEKTFMLLTRLCLTGMFVTRDIVANIGFSSPNLEEVCIVNCRMDDFHLPFNATWSKLRRLIIRGGPSLVGLELSAPNIQYLEMAVFVWDLHLGNMRNLAEVVFNLKNQTGPCYWDIDLIDVLDGLRWMKMLTLTHGFLEALPYNGEHVQLQYLLSNLQVPFADPSYDELPMLLGNLEHFRASTTLEGSALSGALCIIRSSPKLKSIWIEAPYGNDIGQGIMGQIPLYRRQLQQTFKQPRCPFSDLEELKLEGFTGSHDQVNFLEFFLRYSPRLQKVFIVFPNTNAIGNDTVASLIKWTVAEIKKLESHVLAPDVEIVFQTNHVEMRGPLRALNIEYSF